MLFEIVEVDRDYGTVTKVDWKEFETRDDAEKWCRDESWTGFAYHVDRAKHAPPLVMKATCPMQISRNEVKLGDTLKLFDGPWGFAIVTQITDDEIIIHRPYGATSDFSYSGGVIFYTGIEVCKYLRTDTRFPTFELWNRKTLR